MLVFVSPGPLLLLLAAIYSSCANLAAVPAAARAGWVSGSGRSPWKAAVDNRSHMRGLAPGPPGLRGSGGISPALPGSRRASGALLHLRGSKGEGERLWGRREEDEM